MAIQLSRGTTPTQLLRERERCPEYAASATSEQPTI